MADRHDVLGLIMGGGAGSGSRSFMPEPRLGQLLASPGDDFGKHVIPQALPNHRLMGYVFDGYWADIGTIRRFYEANLELVAPDRPLKLLDPQWPIYTHPRFLPPSEVHGARLNHALLAGGCCIFDSDICHSVVGLRSVIGPRATIRSSGLMGADYYEADEAKAANRRLGRPDIGIGEGWNVEARQVLAEMVGQFDAGLDCHDLQVAHALLRTRGPTRTKELSAASAERGKQT